MAKVNQIQRVNQKIEAGDKVGPAEDQSAEKMLLCMHGVHHDQYPVRGLTVREARALLTPLQNVDPQAIAVINGEEVSEDTVIDLDAECLTFVKQAAVKGAELNMLVTNVCLRYSEGDVCVSLGEPNAEGDTKEYAFDSDYDRSRVSLNVPLSQARDYFVGQQFTVAITPVGEVS